MSSVDPFRGRNRGSPVVLTNIACKYLDDLGLCLLLLLFDLIISFLRLLQGWTLAHSCDLIHRCALQRASLSTDHLHLYTVSGKLESHKYRVKTYDIISNISLDDNFILSLRVLRDTTARCKLACELLCGLFEVYSKELKTVYMRLVLSLGPL